jgi:hypothetical protein
MKILVLVLAGLFVLLVLGRWAGGLVMGLDDEANFALDLAIAGVGLVFALFTIMFVVTARDRA